MSSLDSGCTQASSKLEVPPLSELKTKSASDERSGSSSVLRDDVFLDERHASVVERDGRRKRVALLPAVNED